MVSKSKKTRIVVETDCGLRKLLAIEERPDRDLGLYLPAMANFEHSRLNRDVELRELRWSLHLGETSSGDTCKFSIITSAGKLDSATFNRARAFQRYTPLFAQRFPDMTNINFNHRPKKADKTIRLCSLDRYRETLLLCVVASAPDAADLMPPPEIDHNRLGFQSWHLHLFWTKIPFSARGDSDFFSAATASPRDDGTKLPGRQISNSRGLDADKVSMFIKAGFSYLCDSMMRRIIGKGPIDLKSITGDGF